MYYKSHSLYQVIEQKIGWEIIFFSFKMYFKWTNYKNMIKIIEYLWMSKLFSYFLYSLVISYKILTAAGIIVYYLFL